MIMTSCNACKSDMLLMNYRLVQFDDCIVVREYFGKCPCGSVVTDEDFIEDDQRYLEAKEEGRYFPRSR